MTKNKIHLTITSVNVFGIIILLNGLTLNLFSQGISEKEAGVRATIVKPVGISAIVNSDYGNGTIIFSASVEMSPLGYQSKKGDIVFPIPSGVFTAATYYFSGESGYTYTISFPSSPLVINNGSSSMKVISFVSNPTKNLGSDLIAGVFVSVTSSSVIVNYN